MPTAPLSQINPLSSTVARVLSRLGPVFALVAVVVFFSAADLIRHAGDGRASFATLRNVRTVLVQTAPVAVASLGMVLVILSAGIDLSVGTATALCATVLAWLLREGYGPLTAVTGSVLTGLLCGTLNGALVGYLRLLPFIATLGTMTVYLGLAKIIAAETTVRPALAQIPRWLQGWLSLLPEDQWPNPAWGVPLGVWAVLPLAAAVAVLLRYHVFGREVYAVGSSEATARLCGVRVSRTKLLVYGLAGVFAGLAGVYQFSRLSVGNPTSGNGLELRVIAAVVVGGASLQGGEGDVGGTLVGAAIMAVIASGCTALSISNPAQDVVIGVVIASAVLVDRLRRG